MTSRSFVHLCALLFMAASAPAQLIQPQLIRDSSLVTYRLTHPLHVVEATSRNVLYRMEIDPAKKEIRSVAAKVDVTTFDSGNSNRDSHAMEVIDAISYPNATFVSTSVTQSGDSIRVAGRLTFHGITRDVVATGTTRWENDMVEFQGGFDVSLTVFHIDRPSLLLIPVEDTLSFFIKAAFRLG